MMSVACLVINLPIPLLSHFEAESARPHEKQLHARHWITGQTFEAILDNWAPLHISPNSVRTIVRQGEFLSEMALTRVQSLASKSDYSASLLGPPFFG